MQDRRSHWEDVYAAKAVDAVSWFQPTAAPSLRMIAAAGVGPGSRLVDVGGGASPLAGELFAQGWRRLTVLDIAETALAVARAALGPAADAVDWQGADVLDWRPDGAYDLWHDRAVFHFLTEAGDRARYRDVLAQALRPGGRVVIGAFAPDGPERCSGLAVRRWSAEALAAELGPGFVLVDSAQEAHHTPGGAVQSFTWTLLQRL